MTPKRRVFWFGIGPRQIERAVDEELAFHIETRVQRLIKEGASPEAARAEAVRQFGDLASVRDDCVAMDQQKERAMNRAHLFGQIREDLGYGFRSLRKASGLSSVAIVTVAFAIAVLTTVFSILDTGFLRQLPYTDADRLVGLNARLPKHALAAWNSVPPAVANMVRHDATSFDRVAAYDGWFSFVLSDKLGAVQLHATRVDTALFGLLGAHAERGRLFTVREVTGDAPVALISDSLWRTRYDRDESVVGSEVHLDGTSRTIVGVLEPGFRFNSTSDLWVPLAERADSVTAADADWYWLVARRKPDVTVARAQAEMMRMARNLAASDPAEFKGLSLTVQRSLINRGNPAYFTMAGLFVVISLAVFLIACTNVGNLLLVRAAERRGEMALRATLGASRFRLLRQSIAESSILAAVSAVLGALLAAAMLRVLLATVAPPLGFPTWMRFSFDWRVFAFIAASAAFAVLLFGLAPARHGTRVNLADALKAASDVVVSDKTVTHRGRRGAVVQIALSLSLLVVTLFFARSYYFLASLDHGYDADGVLHAYIALDRSRYDTQLKAEVPIERVRDRLAADTRVEAATLSGPVGQLRRPVGLDSATARKRFAGLDSASALKDSITGYWLYLPGHDETPADNALQPGGRRLAVEDGYFRILRISLLRGRSFNAGDVAGGQRVAIVSQRLAGVLWPGADAVGKLFHFGRRGAEFLVVGVVGDVRDAVETASGQASTAPWPNVYFSTRQVTYRPELYIRTRTSVAAMQPLVESALRAVDPMAVAGQLTTMRQSSGSERIDKMLGVAVGVVAASGAFLAMLGVYGVIAYGVTRRTREIGLRIALGATREQAVELFTRQGLRLTAIGLAIGLVLATGVARLTGRFVWGVSFLDPMTYVVAAVAFGAIAMSACWLAARRAAHVEPRDALRTL